MTVTFRALALGRRLDEFDIAKTAQNYGGPLLARIQRDPSLRALEIKTLDAFWPLLAQADPTRGQDYSVWMVKTYVKDESFRWAEDSPRMKEWIASFDDLKRRSRLPADQRDIMRVKRFVDLMTLVEKFSDTLAVTKDKRSALDDPNYQRALAESPLVHEDQFFKVYVPKTLFAAAFWSKLYSTKFSWCTHEKGYFESYTKDGPLYTFIPKSPKFKGEKFQLHIHSSQLMDRMDQPYDPFDDPRFFPFIARLKRCSVANLVKFMPLLNRNTWFQKANWSILDQIDPAKIDKYREFLEFDLETLHLLEDPRIETLISPQFREFWATNYRGFPKVDLMLDLDMILSEFAEWKQARAPSGGKKPRSKKR